MIQGTVVHTQYRPGDGPLVRPGFGRNIQCQYNGI